MIPLYHLFNWIPLPFYPGLAVGLMFKLTPNPEAIVIHFLPSDFRLKSDPWVLASCDPKTYHPIE